MVFMLPVIGEMVMPRAVLTPEELAAKATVVPEDVGIDLGYAANGFAVSHGGTGDAGGAVTSIEMLAMSDLSLMVKAGVQWGLFGGAIENLGTERHHQAYVKPLIDPVAVHSRRCGEHTHVRTRRTTPYSRCARHGSDPEGDSRGAETDHRRRDSLLQCRRSDRS